MSAGSRSVSQDSLDQARNDAAFAKDIDLVLSFDGGPREELDRAARPGDADRDVGFWGESGGIRIDEDIIFGGQFQIVRVISGRNLEWKDTHSDQVRPVNALDAPCEHGSHAEQRKPLGRPVPRRARAVALAGEKNHGAPLAVLLRNRPRSMTSQLPRRAA
jgi:hypothetical protein